MAKPSRFESREAYEAWKRERFGAAESAPPAEPPVRLPARPAAAPAPPKCATCSAALPAADAVCPACDPEALDDSGLELAERTPRPASPPPAAEAESARIAPAPPAAVTAPTAPEPSEEELKAIGGAASWGVVSGVITSGFAIFAIASGTPLMGLSAWSLVDAGLLFGLAYGTRRRSRACAAGLLGYFVLGKIALIAETGRFQGAPLAILIGWYMLRGARASFALHARTKAFERETAASAKAR